MTETVPWLSRVNDENPYTGQYSRYVKITRPTTAAHAVSAANSFGSVNGLSPARRQAITWTNATQNGLVSIKSDITYLYIIELDAQQRKYLGC